MRKGIIFALLFTAPVMVQAGVYTCEVGGKKVYQSTPCKTADAGSSRRLDNTFEYKTGSAVSPSNLYSNTTSSSGSGKSSEEALAESRKPIDFGDNSYSILTKATAIIESIAVDGRDCEWALKVDERQIHKCTKYLPRIVEGGEYTQAYNAVIGVLKNDPAFYAANKSKFSAVQRTMDRIAQYTNFAMVHLVGNK
jgi:hypothetical protein